VKEQVSTMKENEISLNQHGQSEFCGHIKLQMSPEERKVKLLAWSTINIKIVEHIQNKGEGS
jgi:hypothetical protein